MFLLEYNIKIGFPSLGWGIILQNIQHAARLVPIQIGSPFEKIYTNALVLLVHCVTKKKKISLTVYSPLFFSQISIGILHDFLVILPPPCPPPLLCYGVSVIDFLMTIKTSLLEQSQEIYRPPVLFFLSITKAGAQRLS